MSIIIDEERFINNNTLLLDEKLKSPTVRFIDQTPTFTTYFHINYHESTNDEGLHDAESIIDKNSPFRYQRIDSFPIYGLESIVLQIQDGEAGLDTSYDGEATILPNTIKPLENDFFIIDILNDCFLFRVTGIEFDTIRPDNFYKIRFKLDSNDQDKRMDLESLVHEKYTCILQNIGTENLCIINRDCKEQLDRVENIYSSMVQLYLSIFYVERYNVLLGEIGNGYLLYDPFMSEFINSHALFYRKSSLTSIYLEDEFSDPKRKLKYERSVYRLFETRDISRMTQFLYTIFLGINNAETNFSKWHDESVYILDIPPKLDTVSANIKINRIFSEEFIRETKFNLPSANIYDDLMKKFIRKETISIFDITNSLLDDLVKLDANLEMFFITPLILYVIKKTIEEFYKTGYDYRSSNNDLYNTHYTS